MSWSESQRFRFSRPADLRLSFGQQIALTLLTLAIWGATHRYSGLWHDGVLYAGQALHRLYPERFAGDLFFVHGSQDSFSIFGPLYAALVRVAGINAASLVLTATAQCAWLIAAAMLARRVFSGVLFWVALLAIVTLPRIYGADEVFSYAETFATARVLAEPLVLAGLACLFGGRRVAGNFFLLGAALFHPVMAFPGIAAAFAMQAPYRAVFVASACALLSIPLLALGIPGSGGPFQTMDPLWYGISLERSPFIFLGRWQLAELVQPVVWAATLFLAGAMSRGVARRFWFAVLYAGTLGFALAAMAEAWPIALLVQMQAWRSAWLLQVCGIFAAVWLIPALWSRGSFGRLMLFAMAACWFAGGDPGLFAGTLLAVSYPILARRQALVDLLGRHYRLISAGFVVACLPELLVVVQELLGAMRAVFIDAVSAFSKAGGGLAIEQPRVFWLTFGAASLLMILNGWREPVLRVLGCLTVALTILISVLSWDASIRAGYRAIIPFDEPPAALRDAIPPGSLTYWEGEHDYLWFALGRPSYASHQQAAGVIFSLRTALEAQRRLNAVALLGTPDGRLQWRPLSLEKTSEGALAPIPAQALVAVCQDPILDYVVLRRSLRGEPRAEPLAVIPVALHKGKPSVRLYVFECRRLRWPPASCAPDC